MYVFIGEKRSPRAQAMDVTWTDGRLAASTLFKALRACGIMPEAQQYCNLYQDRDGWHPIAGMTAALRRQVDAGYILVSLGSRVHRILERSNLPHQSLIHPAARGAIRLTAAYQAHVAERLLPNAMKEGSHGKA